METHRIFVTGGTGFLGSHFLRAALIAGHAITALRYDGSRSPIPLDREPDWLDGTMRIAAEHFPAGIDTLVHLAAAGVNPARMTWEECFRVNVQESVALWQAAAQAGVRRLLICGSCFEYGKAAERMEAVTTDAPLEPVGPYAASKAAASLAAMALGRELGLEVAVIRPFHIFGEGEAPDRFWPSLRRAALAGEDFPMTAGKQVRDFTPVGEVATAFIRALTIPIDSGSPKVFHIGTGAPKTLKEFATEWWEKWNAKGNLHLGKLPYRPNEVMRYVPGPDFL